MAGPYLWLRVELGPAVREHGELLSVGLGAPWFSETRLWLGGTPSPTGRVSGSGLSKSWVVLEPPPLPATGRDGPGIGICVGTECPLSCDALTSVQSSPMCTYPDVLLYLLLFPCFRLARILKRFVSSHERDDAPVSAVLCLPACLCVSTAASCGQAPTGRRRKRSTAAGLPVPCVPLGAT